MGADAAATDVDGIDAALSRAGLPAIGHGGWVEVDLTALVDNARSLRAAIPASTRLGILVKANGYGHGLEMSARAAVEGGADRLIVAGAVEGFALREAGVGGPILVVYPVPASELGAAADKDLEVSVSGLASARATRAAWARHRRTAGARELRVHVEIDTGMGRGGVDPHGIAEVVRLLSEVDGIRIVGAWSHLADGTDPASTGDQVARFERATQPGDSHGPAGLSNVERHMAASDGLLSGGCPPFDLVRVGLAFYGELGLEPRIAPEMAATAAALRPALTIKARPVRIEAVDPGSHVGYGGEWTAGRASRIATLPIGYADGWQRAAWPGCEVLVRGRRAPIAGRVSMDAIGVDVTDIAGVGLDDEFVLLGAQGSDRITANEVARGFRTIPNDVLASIGPRLPRVYRRGDEIVGLAQQATRVRLRPTTKEHPDDATR